MRRAMEHAGIKQPRMIVEFASSKTTIGRWTHDDPAAKGPSPAELRQWADLCNVSYEWLVTGAGSHEEPAPSHQRPVITPARDAALRAADDAYAQAELQARPDREKSPNGAGS